MSCSFRSRKSSRSAAARIFSTALGPSWQNSCSPTFTARTDGATAVAQAVAVARSEVSSATAIGATAPVMPLPLSCHCPCHAAPLSVGAGLSRVSLGVLEGDRARSDLFDDGRVAGWVRLFRDHELRRAVCQADGVAQPVDAALDQCRSQLPRDAR